MAIHEAQFGEPPSPRETQVAIALLFGRTTHETAQDLGLSYKTIIDYRTRLYVKFGARGHIDLMLILLGKR